MNQQKVAELIHEECAAIAAMLTEKNRKYGNAVIEPVSVFSRSDALERINVRIDDKLQRMANRQNDEDEDVEKDLIGYLLYRRVVRRMAGQDKGAAFDALRTMAPAYSAWTSEAIDINGHIQP